MNKKIIKLNGQLIEVNKDVYDAFYGINGELRHERYVLEELVPRYELSLEGLEDKNYQVYNHMVIREKSIEEELIERFESKKLLEAILYLNDDERFIIQKIYFENMTERELSKKISIPQRTINYRKRKILKKLKLFLKNS